MYQAKQVLTRAEEIKSSLGDEIPSQVRKVIDHIDDLCRAWIEHSPFIVISSANAAGAMDVSPKGDPAGFVKVLDRQTLAIPDRLGNNRGDTFFNVIENPKLAIMFVIPRRSEVVRVSGSAMVVKDPELLETMTVNRKTPDLALLVRVEEAMFHCGKSMIRSNLWKPEHWGSIEGLPSYAEALIKHAQLPNTLEDMLQRTAANETEQLY